MPQAIVRISKTANRVLNIIKARYDLRTKSEAINKLAEGWGAAILEPELRPEFVQKMARLQKEKTVRVGSIKDFKKRYAIK